MSVSVIAPASLPVLPATGQAPLIALIPALDPPDALTALATDLVGRGFVLVVVDDGTDPSRSAIFDQLGPGVVLLRHPDNRGKGAALRTGLSWIEDHYPSQAIVVTLDADGQHLPADVERVGTTAREHPGDLVLGARLDTATTPRRSRMGHQVTRTVFRLASGKRLTDTQTGLRAFPAGLIPDLLAIPGDHFDYESNMLLSATRQGIPLREVGITTVYEGAAHSSHFRSLVDSLRIGRGFLAFSASSFSSFLLDYALFAVLLPVGRWLGIAQAVIVANVIARVVSAAFNYLVNSRLVFRQAKDEPEPTGGSRRERLAGAPDPAGATGRRIWNRSRTLWQYILLALGILIANTAVLALVTSLPGVSSYVAKIGVELSFFLLSFVVQHLIIFRRRDGQAMRA